VLPRLAYLTPCRSIQLLALLARSDAAKDLEILVPRPPDHAGESEPHPPGSWTLLCWAKRGPASSSCSAAYRRPPGTSTARSHSSPGLPRQPDRRPPSCRLGSVAQLGCHLQQFSALRTHTAVRPVLEPSPLQPAAILPFVAGALAGVGSNGSGQGSQT
jgi:hypothetical protein